MSWSYQPLIPATILLNDSPTVALNTPADAGTVTNPLAVFDFTGTDTESNSIEYNIKIVMAGTTTMASMTTTQYADSIMGGTAGSGEAQQARGQSFTADGGDVTEIDIYTYKQGTPTGDWVLTLRSTSITGTVMGTVTKACSTLTSNGWSKFVFSAPIATTNTVKYYIQIVKSPDVLDATNYNSVGIHDSNLYASGGYWKRQNNSWGTEDTTTYDMLFKVIKATAILDKVSTSDAGFANPDNGGDTHPFNAGENIQYTVQTANALIDGSYFWMVRGIDPTGSNAYGAWTAWRSFTVATTTRYWVGGTHNWSDLPFANISGGAAMTGIEALPTSAMDVVVDANSGFGAGGTISLDSFFTQYCKNFTCTSGHTFTVDGGGYSSELLVYGSFTLEAGVTWSLSDLTFRGVGTHTITTAGVTLTGTYVYFSYTYATGTFTLQDHLVTTDEVDIEGGTFDANDKNITARSFYFYADTYNDPTVYGGSGTWLATGNDDNGSPWFMDQYTNGVVNYISETSTIKFTDATAFSKTFEFYDATANETGKTYNKLWLSGAGTGTFLIQGSNTFGELKADTPPHTIKFAAGSTQTITTWSISGTAGNLMTIDGIEAGKAIATSSLNAGGSGWVIDDTFTVNGGTTTATGHVTGVSSGAVTTYVLDNYGLGYSTGTGIDCPVDFGAGTGLKINILTVTATNIEHNLSKSTGTVNADYLDLSNSNAIGGAIWNAGSHSANTTNNTGWIFGATTAQTITGKARIALVTPQTKTGKARVTASTPQTKTGKARIALITAQTRTGVARILKTVTQTKTGKARIGLITAQTKAGKARIALITAQTKTGLARIKVSTTRTIQGIARVTATTTRTIGGKGDIKKTTSQTISGKARIGLVTTKTLSGKGRIGLITTKTLQGVARIQKTVAQTKSGIARITAQTLQTLSGKARITASTLRTITGLARIQKSASQTSTGKARITATTSRTIAGLSRITASTIQTLNGLARITASTTKNLLGLARIQKSVIQNTTGKSRIQKSVSQTLSGVANIALGAGNQTLSGKARIQVTTTRTTAGKARIALITTQSTLGKARIQKSASQTVTGVARITIISPRTITGKGRIGLITTQTRTGVARITISTPRTINGKASIKRSSAQTISGTGRIEATATQTIDGVAKVINLPSQHITGLARLQTQTLRTTTAKARVQKSVLKTIFGIAWVIVTPKRTITGKAKIKKAKWYRGNPRDWYTQLTGAWMSAPGSVWQTKNTLGWYVANEPEWWENQ